jgi:hypothetical protein
MVQSVFPAPPDSPAMIIDGALIFIRLLV